MMLAWSERRSETGVLWVADTPLGQASICKTRGGCVSLAPFHDSATHRGADEAKAALEASWLAALCDLADALDAVRADRAAQ